MENIPADKPCVLFLGGIGTENNATANGYMSIIEDFFKRNNINNNADIYSVIYYFGKEKASQSETFLDYLARKKLFQDHLVPYGNPKYRIVGNQNIYQNPQDKKVDKYPIPEDTLSPNHIKELFDNAFLSRICDQEGKKLPINEACKRMRNLTVCAHCHGAYTFLKIEEMLQQKMKEVGFTDEERTKIQKELLCLTCAPEAPLGKSKSTMISFISTNDEKTNSENNFSKAICSITSREGKIAPAFFPNRQGNCFLTSDLTLEHEDNNNEHDFLRYKDWNRLSPDGQKFLNFLSNAVANSVKGAINGNPLPSVKELVCAQYEESKKLFDQMEETGRKLWNDLTQITKLRLASKLKQH